MHDNAEILKFFCGDIAEILEFPETNNKIIDNISAKIAQNNAIYRIFKNYHDDKSIKFSEQKPKICIVATEKSINENIDLFGNSINHVATLDSVNNVNATIGCIDKDKKDFKIYDFGGKFSSNDCILRGNLVSRAIEIEEKKHVNLSKLVNNLIDLGYFNKNFVIEPGEFAVRGDILDIFLEKPYRIEFFCYEIESIRIFDVATQKSVKKIKNFIIFPIKSSSVSDNEKSILEHIQKDELCTIYNLDEIISSENYKKIAEEIEKCSEKIEILNHKSTEKEFIKDFYCREITDINFSIEKVKNLIKNSGKSTLIGAYSEVAKENIEKIFSQEFADELPINKTSENSLKFSKISQGIKAQVSVHIIPFEKSFETKKHIFIAEKDLFKSQLSNKKYNKKNFLTDLAALTEGDFVVHQNHGIGRFARIETLEINQIRHDFLLIFYANDDKLFVPIENVNLISRYGSDASGAQLSSLGGNSWNLKKEKIRKKITELSKRLVETAALRRIEAGFTVDLDRAYQDFCEKFEFVETEDQAAAIRDIETDLTSGKIMERLLCGDVGFGKTEVAMRAAFLVAKTGRQVAILVPTTILAKQHFENFTKRFLNSGISSENMTSDKNSSAAQKDDYEMAVESSSDKNIESNKNEKYIKFDEKIAKTKPFLPQICEVSRFTKNDHTDESIENGRFNIIIGTKSLLNKKFYNLGLLIVDEEQHFGVAEKEKIKEMKKNIHVLTLSATPIPRTLQLSLVGIRDLSIITTPPFGKIATKTYIAEFGDQILVDAISFELQRNGQVFYVCPRIKDIAEVEEFVTKNIAGAKIVIAHSKLRTNQLEAAINGFISKQFNILIATNIIESGIDISNANTLIVHNAEFFGLSSLYQLRGRVGRSNVQSYAYFTVKKDKILTKQTEKRLTILKNLDKLGSGFTIASYDMDIRGAGNVLGEEQSGHIKEIGAELYQKMVKAAIDEIKHNASSFDENADIKVNLLKNILIPSSYIADNDTKLSYYRKISNILSDEEQFAIYKEMRDRFGQVPDEVKNLFFIVKIKNLAKNAGISKISELKTGEIILELQKFNNVSSLIQLIKTDKNMALIPENKIKINSLGNLEKCLILISEINKTNQRNT